MTSAYYVWRRSDGYVDATCFDVAGRPATWGTIGGQPVTFESLLITTDWPKARDLVEAERAKPDYPTYDWM